MPLMVTELVVSERSSFESFLSDLGSSFLASSFLDSSFFGSSFFGSSLGFSAASGLGGGVFFSWACKWSDELQRSAAATKPQSNSQTNPLFFIQGWMVDNGGKVVKRS